MPIILIMFYGCSSQPTKDTIESSQADTASQVDDTGLQTRTDPDENGRSGLTFCSSGGLGSSTSYAGSTCFAPVDVGAAPESSSESYTWQPGPVVPVSR